MTKRWNIIEKVIGSIQITFGFYAFYMFIKNLRELIEAAGYSLKRALELYLPEGHNGVLMGVLSLTSGFLIILNKKNGWIGSVAIWLALIILSIMFMFHGRYYELIDLIYFVSLIIIMFSFIFLLTRKPFLNKYKPNLKSYAIIIIIISLIIIDRLIFWI